MNDAPHTAFWTATLVLLVLKLLSTVIGVRLKRAGTVDDARYAVVFWISKVTPPLFALTLLADGILRRDLFEERVGIAALAAIATLLPLVFWLRSRGWEGLVPVNRSKSEWNPNRCAVATA
jgi:hypothetical protein